MFVLMKYVEKFFKMHGVKGSYYNEKKLEKLEVEAAKYGVKFLKYRTYHVGTDELPKIVSNIRKSLEKNGVEFILNTRISSLKTLNSKVVSAVTAKGYEIRGDYFILAPGRNGSTWIKKVLEEIYSSSGIRINIKFNSIDIGVRVEVPKEVLKEIVEDYGCIDPKFYIRTKTYDDLVRTFCVCHKGFVVLDPYRFVENGREETLYGVNGQSFKHRKSINSNLSILVRINLTKPFENTTEYGRSIVRTTNILGGRNPIILQRLIDLKRGRRSTDERVKRNHVEPTLKNYTAGDIAIAYPLRILQDIIEALETLNKLIPGINEGPTLLYAPEVKFYSYKVETNKYFQTKIPNLYVVGDGSGHSRGITGAAATGIIAARKIIREIG